MPAKGKSLRPKMKVEEVEEEPEVEESVSEEKIETLEDKDAKTLLLDETPSSEKTQVESEKTSILEPPKVVSFSQLGSTPLPSKETQEGTEVVKESTPEGEPEKEVQEERPEATEEVTPEKKEVSSDEIKEWLKEVRPDTSKEVEKTGGPNAKVVLLIAAILLVVGAIVGGVIYNRQKNSGEPETTPQQEMTATETPAPTAAPEEVDMTTLSVSVLNGSGVAGEAGKVKSLLTKETFSEDKVKTGNADASTYKVTTVSLKESLSETVFDEIKVLLGTYEVGKAEDPLDADSSYDVIIIVGTQKSS